MSTVRAVSSELELELSRLRKRSVWRRILDFFFGYDFVISYRWSDGTVYAVQLAKALKQRGYECFLDLQNFTVGDDWKTAGAGAIRRTSQLAVIGSPQVLDSAAVLREIAIFVQNGRKVIPVNIGGSLDSEKVGGTPIERFITDAVLQIREDPSCLAEGPSNNAIEALEKAHKTYKQSVKRIRALQGFAGVLIISTVAALGDR